MLNNLSKVIREINYLKRELGNLWVSKGKTDQEVLDLAEKIDNLLNKYYLLKYPSHVKTRDSRLRD